jgi:hypothetical protein
MVTKVYVFEYKRAANAAKGEGGETASSRFSLVKEYVAPDLPVLQRVRGGLELHERPLRHDGRVPHPR